MGEVIKQSQLRNDNAEVMRRVAAGESFTITVNGQPVADLVPHQRVQLRRAIPAEELDALMADLPPMDVDSWKQERDDLDQEAHDPHGSDASS
ncbi:type II toxin-antitoxin system prevent-host-death family antitoxin [Pseudonocardia sp. NPDC049154]|uniref:type II toxin-antitoxin system Phd/YefM family antitoxin n=1 Tax=Pseudonocardia sp. NPDC049154 TaxID=3155501 RepID=UPI0033E4F31A